LQRWNYAWNAVYFITICTKNKEQTTNEQPIPQPIQTIGRKRFQNQGKNTVSSIIGGYESAVTKHANRLGSDFAWQSRFYDHIIRDKISFDNISNYIKNNPKKWREDELY